MDFSSKGWPFLIGQLVFAGVLSPFEAFAPRVGNTSCRPALVSAKTLLNCTAMVISESVKSKKKPLSIHYTQHKTSRPLGEHSPEENDNRELDKQQEALAVVLPRLLKHTTGFLNLTRKQLEDVHISNNDEEGSFGSWLSKFNNFFSSRKKARGNKKVAAVPVTPSQMTDFFGLLENPRIRRFLEEQDGCYIYADSYLLAMVFTFFLRAGFTPDEFNQDNFFIALVLAHDIEEENYMIDVLIANWEAENLHKTGDEAFVPMSVLRYQLFRRMDYRALVSRRCCEEVMSIYPEHFAWRRERAIHHAGVDQERRNPLNFPQFVSLWPWGSFVPSPRVCVLCDNLQLARKEAARKKKAGGRLSLKKRPFDNNSPVMGIKKEKRPCTLANMVELPFKVKEEFCSDPPSMDDC